VTTFTRTWNSTYEGDPANSQALSLGAQRIREFKVDAKERGNVDHYWGQGAQDGRHRFVYLPIRTSTPAPVTENSLDFCPLYVINTDPDGDLKFRRKNNTVVTLSHGEFPFLLTSVNDWQKAQRSKLVTLTDAATIAIDAEAANMYKVTLAGNRTLGLPTNLVAGWNALIYVRQDGTGNRTLAYNASWNFPLGIAPILTTAANSVDILSVAYDGTTLVLMHSKDFK